MKKDHVPPTYRDPVCGMELGQNTAPTTAEFEGKTYYFCADPCREAFEAAPEKYLGRREARRGAQAVDIGVKEIKAYVRPELLERIIGQLEEAGAQDMTVIRVDALGQMADFEEDRSHFWRKYKEKYSKIAKLEIVCRDEEVDSFVTIIRTGGHLGESGDGRIFVSSLEKAVNIRTGAQGKDALSAQRC